MIFSFGLHYIYIFFRGQWKFCQGKLKSDLLGQQGSSLYSFNMNSYSSRRSTSHKVKIIIHWTYSAILSELGLDISSTKTVCQWYLLLPRARTERLCRRRGPIRPSPTWARSPPHRASPWSAPGWWHHRGGPRDAPTPHSGHRPAESTHSTCKYYSSGRKNIHQQIKVPVNNSH